MNGTYGTTTALVPGSRLIDDLLRRELRVGDPTNAMEVAAALRKRYAAEAVRLDQEGAGLPIRYDVPAMVLTPPAAASDTPGTKEERRVLANLDSDLSALIDSRDNREWTSEIRGWRDTLLRELAEGPAAARLAQDPAMRDRGFLAVRKFGEFARVARLVGVLNLPLNADYRRLATTLDDAASVVRILMGEALFNAGLAQGGLIIQVPLFELRDRRDALVFAVRRLSGLEVDTENDDWGDALAAYRALLNELQRRGARELRVYLRPDLLGTIVDGLVGEIARQDPDSLRQVAATSPVEIARMTRLFEIASQLLTTTPQGPITAALSLYVRTLELFLDGFTAIHGGARLIDLAMPLPLAAQQSDEPDREGRRALRDLVNLCGEYAQEVECFMSGCGCNREDLRCQVQLDKVLYDVDRAIDLYAQGSGIPPAWGPEEQRAAVYGLVARNLATSGACVSTTAVFDVLLEAARTAVDLMEAVNQIQTVQATTDTATFLRHALDAASAGMSSNALAESIRRGLFDVPASIQAAVNDSQHRLNAIANAARTSPLGIDEAVQVLVDTIELAVGAITVDPASIPATSTTAGIVNLTISEIHRSPGTNGFDVVGTGLVALGFPTGNRRVARDTLSQGRIALRSAVRAIGDPSAANAQANRDDALQRVNAAANAIEIATQALNPVPPATIPAGDRIMLGGAIDATTSARDLASRIGRLPVTRAIEPIALGQLLNDITNVLLAAVPDPATIEAVFDEQLRAEEDWQTLVQTLAPRCLGQDKQDLVLAALELLRASPRRTRRADPVTPFFPDDRVSLASIAADVGRVRGIVDETINRAADFGQRFRRPGLQLRGLPRTSGVNDVVRDAIAAARDVAGAAVDVARDTDIIDDTRDRVINRIRRAGGQSAKTADIREYVSRLYPNARSRGEVRDAVKEDPTLRSDWEQIKETCAAADAPLDEAFSAAVDDLFDEAKRSNLTPQERRRLRDVCGKAMYPLPLPE